jgi:hypothetical protein
MNRGAVSKKDAVLIAAWFPLSLVRGLDRGVVVEDLDRSKFIRAAVREKLNRINRVPAGANK